ncbi:MAG: amino acid adenylation domain-containing protein [Chthoniobacterales bacterium]
MLTVRPASSAPDPAASPRTRPAEIHRTQANWEGAALDYPAIPVHRYIEAHAARRSGATALIFAKQQLSYQELNHRANQLAHYLLNAGVGPEVRVAMCLRPSLDVAVTLLAILKAGGVYVPLDPTDPVERIATILKDSQPEIVLTKSYLLSRLPAIAATQLFCADRNWESLQSLPVENPNLEIDLEHTAYLVYTSGTTGKPKGVMASHRNLVHYILSARDRYRFDPQDIMPAVARITFSISLFELLSPLVAGGTLLVLERDQVLNLKRMVQVLEQVTIIHASPSLWRKLIAYLLANSLDDRKFQRLKHVSSGGDMVPSDLLVTMQGVFRNAEIFVIYGCTEISCMGCTYPVLKDRKSGKHWVGKPFSNVVVRLVDQELVVLPDGVQGEICFAGPGVTKGYLNLPGPTQEKFLTINGQRFYRTGDFGRFEDGNLEILGRADFQIQLRGIRIEPDEIEAHLRQTPGVRDAVVVAREFGHSEKSLIAYIVLEEKERQDIETIRRFLEAKLPDYMMPAAFVVLDAIPVNSNQKVDRRALPAPTAENVAVRKAVVPPRNDWEKHLVKIWENTLELKPIGIRNTFFELGGDSLQAVQILIQIEERWNKTLPFTIFLEAKTIEALTEIIREVGGGKDHLEEENVFGKVVPLGGGGSKAPLFCLQGVLLYQAMAQCVDPDQPVYGVFLQEEVELLKTNQYDPVNSVFSSIPRIASRYLQLIRSVQPYGPYYLSGSSFAGLIAFEMAHQLRAAGEEVALVAMFDSLMIRKIPLYRRLQCHWDLLSERGFRYLLERAQHRIVSIWRRMTAYSYKLNEQIRSRDDRSLRTISVDVQEDILDEVSAQAARSYVPRPYSGKVVLFRATDQSFFSEDSPDLGWRPFAGAEFEICDIPGNHLGILKDVSVSILARRLQTYLDKTNPR